MSLELARLLFPGAWIETDGCWPWARGVNGHGYGIVTIAGNSWGAHRAVFVVVDGPVPDGLDVDHVCHNSDAVCAGGDICLHRRCVRPDHLRAVPRRENLLAGRTRPAVNAAKTHCARDHPFDEANTRRHGNRRYCIACQNERNARRPARDLTDQHVRDEQHGTLTGYTMGCRCESCRRSMRVYQAARRARQARAA